MAAHKIHIKNMVCPRCISSVRIIMESMGLEVEHIGLGLVIIERAIREDERKALSDQLKQSGFELLEDHTSRMISMVKSIIVDQIHHQKEAQQHNFSTLLSEKLNQNYSSISKLFSSVEGITIEKFILKQRIEKVKELMIYDELNLSEIAFKLNYSSVAHLSAQFKKETGMTPSAFRKLEKYNRQSLDTL